MSGKVWEWCWNLFFEDDCIRRGGSWFGDEDTCEVTFRALGFTTYSIDDVGFRMARTLE
jgi:formylglycine-generating enzyme required for sulfatase activity